MGSTILAYPALVRVQRYRNIFIYSQTNVESVELLNLFPRVNVLTIEEKRFSKFVRSFMLALIHIRELKIGTVIDVE